MRIIRAIINILTSSKGRKGRQRVLASLMAVVVFCTTYTLILPAITLDRQTAESEPGIEAETAAEETLGEVQDADLLLAGQNAEEDETVAVETETEEIVNTSAETEEVVSDPETEEAASITETEAVDLEEELEPETEEVYAESPLIYHCDQYDIELSFDSDEWQLPEGTVLSVKELHKDAEEDSEEYNDYHYYDDRAKEELSDQDEALAERADVFHFYELQLKADGEEFSMPEGEADITIKYNSKDKTDYNAKEFGDEETILASLFWLTDWHTYLFDENEDESKVYTIKDKHLKEIKIKDVELSDFDNVIGLYACPPEKKVTLKAEGSDYSVTAVCGQKSGVPEDAKLTVSEIKPGSKEFEQYLDSAREALGEEKENEVPAVQARFFDIKIMVDGEEFTPEAEIDVKIDFHEPVVVEQMQDVNAVHFGEEGTEVLDVTTEESKEGIENVSFTADSFSVYGVVYTVDFHYEVNGKTYDFSIPGGGFVSLEHVVEVLGIATADENTEKQAENTENGTENEDEFVGEVPGVDEDSENGTAYEEAIKLNEVKVSEATKKFVADVESVEFSNPELVWVGKVGNENTVGELKEDNGLKVEYSAELTEEQIAEINAQTVEVGDWALISVQPFRSEETLTVTMKNGEVFIIEVTDGQIRTYVISDSGDTYRITVTYDDSTGIPADAELRVRQLTPDDDRYQEDIDRSNAALLARYDQEATNPLVFEIKIFADGKEIEPIEGTQVSVEVTLVMNAMNGELLEENDEGAEEAEPVKEAAPEEEGLIVINGMEYTVEQVDAASARAVHLTDDGEVEVIEDLNGTVDADHNLVLTFETESFSDYLFDGANGTGLYDLPNTIYVGDEIYMWNQANYWVSEIGRVVTETKANNSDNHKTVTAISTGTFRIYNRYNQGEYKEITVRPARTGTTPPAPISTVDNATIGLTLNLFDYDLDGSLDSYFNNYDHNNNPVSAVFLNENDSINNGNALKFWGSGIGTQHGNCNQFQAHVVANIVNDTLDTGEAGGYPVVKNNAGSSGNRNLSYLFEPSDGTDKKAYTNVNHLFKKVGSYYVYDSDQNYAYYDVTQGNGGDFVVYNGTYNQRSGSETGSTQNKKIGFFPFHKWDDQYDLYVKWNKNLNHHFGMSMSVDFSLPPDPMAVKDTDNKDVVFEFSGDDDLWVFIDGKLAMDIGGVHQPTDGSINFTNHTVTVNRATQKTTAQFDSLFSNLYDGNKHTLQVFYIERGGCDSNCMIKFNLTQYGDIEFDKVDEDNPSDKLGGAVFGIYEDQACTIPVMWTHKNGTRYPYVAESDANGHVKFEKLPLGNYYMKELKAPDGYPLDPAVHTVSVYLAQEGANSLVKVKVSINGIDVVTPGVQIENKKPDPIDLGLKKVWVDQNGTTISAPANATATFELKRTRTYTEITQVEVDNETEPVSHLIVGWVHNGQTHIHNEYDLIAGSTATISWTYENGYTGAKGSIINGTENIKTTTGLTLSEAVIMPAEGETATLYIIDGSEHGEAIKSINVAGRQYSGIPGYGFIHEFTTITEPDPDFQYTGDPNTGDPNTGDPNVVNNRVTLPINGNTWEYDFVNLPLVYREPNTTTTYSYTYYLEEVSSVSPEGTTVIYTDRAGNVINAADDAETNQSGTQTVKNKVDLGALELTKKITITDANGQTQSMTQPNPWVNGTVSFTIDGVEGTFTKGIHHEVEITYAAGKITAHKIDGTLTEINPAVTGTSYSVFLNNLVPGDYVIKETGSSNMTLTGITGGKNDADLTEKTVTVTVTHGKNTTDTLTATAKAEFTNNLETRNVTATKTWADLNEGTTHPTIYFRLFYHSEDGDVAVDGVKLKPLPNGTTSVTWENVPKYDQNGQPYDYLVKEYIQKEGGEFTEDEVSYTEAAPNGYVATELGLSVTNTESDKYDPRTSYTGRKVWVDTSNNGATRPDNLTVTLMIDKTGDGPSDDDVAATNNGTPYTPVWNKPAGSNEWTYTFNNLPVYDADWNIIHYYAVETPVNGYVQDDPSITGTKYVYQNTYTAQHIPNDAEVTISSEINLLPFMAIETKDNAYGKKYHVWTVRVATEDEKAELIRIFNEERGYNSTITLENTRFVSGLPVSKTGDGNVEYLYKKNNYKISISKTSGDILKVTVDGSRFMQDMIVGTLAYEYSAGGTVLQNTLETEDYDIRKTWGSGQTPPEGAEVQFTLTATIPGTATEEDTNPDPVAITDLTTLGIAKSVITLNGGLKEGDEYTGDDTTEEPWVYHWTNLPQYDKSGNRITYSASETGYTIDGETVDLTGLAPATTSEGNYELITTNRIPTQDISAHKYWPEGQTVPEGTHIKLTITAKLENGTAPNGVTVTPATVTLDGKVTANDPAEVETADTLWQYTWQNLPKYDKDGKKVIYTVAETEYKIGDISYEDLLATANQPAHEGVDFSFTNELPVTRITVNKTWSNNSGAWPEGVSVIMTLKGEAPTGENGAMTEIETLVIPDYQSVPQTAAYALSGSETSHTWYNLPIYTREGLPITYTVDETGMTYTAPGEDPVPIENWAQAFTWTQDGNAENGFTIDNTPLTTEISLTKVWTLNGQPKPMEDGDSIEFKLYRTDAQDELTLSADGYTANKGTATLNKILYVGVGDNPGWQTVTISKLPKYVLKLTADGTSAFYTDIAYYAVETNVTGNPRVSYTLSPMNVSTGSGNDGGEDTGNTGATGATETTDPTQSAVGTGTITIYNRNTEVDIDVLKVDETDTDKYLAGAEFQILMWSEENARYMPLNLETMEFTTTGQEFKSKLTTSAEEGKLTFENLLDGKYQILETKSPDGYIKIDEVEMFFTIDDGTVTWTDTNGNGIGSDNKPEHIKYDDLTFTVDNTPGAALPNTGGSGTTLIYLLGSILILGAGVLLWRRRRLI